MTSIPLFHLSWYLTSIATTWRDKDYRAHALVKIAKREAFNSTLRVTIEGQAREFTQENGQDFVPYLGRAIAKDMAKSLALPVTLVPIPNSHITGTDKTNFKTKELAEQIAAHNPAQISVAPVLHWHRPKPKAHSEGGVRDIDAHYGLFRLSGDLPKGNVVLFDDVKTSGSQLIAAYRKLRDAGVTPTCAVVIGHATPNQETEMIKWTETQLIVEDDDENVEF
jgi:hypothetical protein